MANLKLLGQNVNAVDVSYTGVSLAANPTGNLLTYDENEYWKAQTCVSGDYLSFDVGASDLRARTGIAIVNHNLSGIMASGALQLQSSTSPSFSTGNVTLLNPLTASTDPILLPFSSSSNRYWRIWFAGNLNWMPRIGQVFIDSVVDFGFPYDLPYRKGAREYKTVQTEMLDGLLRSHQAIDGRRTFKFAFKGEKGGISDSVATDWAAFFQRVRGRLRPFVMLDADGTTTTYVYLDTDVDPMETFRLNINSLEIPFKEARAR